MKLFHKAFWLTLILAIALAAGCGKPGEETAPSNESADPAPKTWKVGVIVPLSGNLAAYGESTLQGIELAAQTLNAAGGVQGRSIELVVENNEGNTVKSAEALRKLVGLNQVHALVGPITSTNALAITPDAQRKGVPLVSPTATNDLVTRDGDFIFRACFNDSFQGVAVAQFARQNVEAATAQSFQDTASDYSVGLCKSFNATFESRGGKSLPMLSYKSKDTDFTPQLRKIREAAPDVVFIPGYPPELPLIVNQARQLGLEATLLGADGWDNQDTVQNAGVNLEGSYFAAAFSPDMTTPALQKFLDLAAEAQIENPGTFEALGYDSLGLVAEAIKNVPVAAGIEEQRKSLKNGLANIRKFQGATGVINMQPNGDPVKSLVILQYIVEEGAVQKQFVQVVEP